MSNEQTAYLIEKICGRNDTAVRNIFLCHVSDNNNTPEMAYRASEEVLEKLHRSDVRLNVLPRRYPSDLFEL